MINHFHLMHLYLLKYFQQRYFVFLTSDTILDLFSIYSFASVLYVYRPCFSKLS
ncbi:hypothetical protein BDF14DRAFT_1867712 [Spinellus fusiger]|nr:hypothetical protein BDF14DRAFT_1867712 [Spinellus fusiger]